MTRGAIPWGRVALLLVAGVSVLLSLWPVIRHPGWPQNHEGHSGPFRVALYSAALQHGEIVPLWDAADVHGMGSPMPLLYHRLFSMVAAPVHLVTGSMKGALLAALGVFGVLGILGLYALAIELGAPFAPALAIAAAFPHLNYSVTDWLVRGAFAEYAAFAFIPWVAWWALRLVTRGVFGMSIAPIVILMFLAHSALTLFALPVVAAAVAVHGVRAPQTLRRWAPRAALAALIVAIVVTPLAAVMWRAMRFTNHEFLQVYRPSQEFQALSRYVFDRSYAWGHDWRRFTVQLDTGLLLGLGLVTALWWWYRRTSNDRPRAALVYCLALLALYAALQLPIAAPVYDLVPGAVYLQFPWRLLAFISVFLVACFVAVSARVSTVRPWLAWAIVVVVSLGVIANNARRPIAYGWLAPELIANPPHRSWAEYWPLITGDESLRAADPRQHARWLDARLRELAQRGPEQLDGAGCTFREIAPGGYLHRAFEIDCEHRAAVALPVTFSGLEEVLLRSAGAPRGGASSEAATRVSTARTHDDPRVRVVAPEGTHEVRVLLPTLPRALRVLLPGRS